MAARKPAAKAAAPAPGALIIPFPRFSRPRSRKEAAAFSTPDFDAGFECAMTMVKALKARGFFRGGF